MITVTSCPNRDKATGNVPQTSPSPPVLANGTASLVAKTIFKASPLFSYAKPQRSCRLPCASGIFPGLNPPAVRTARMAGRTKFDNPALGPSSLPPRILLTVGFPRATAPQLLRISKAYFLA